jgi:DNA-binding beta-propeller fold protein YncE
VEGLSAPYGLALDPIDGSLLVADADLGTIFRWDPVTTTLESWLPDAGTHPSFVVFDEATEWVYWTDNRDNVVRRRQRSGGPVEVIAEGLAGPRGFVLVRQDGFGVGQRPPARTR